jgi:2-C-methyl-D-erythritol 4-phosphate cytidylyltransferase/2-C-methyl-D-erythritol 2,4-cyclodiphosphate synthase
MGAPTPTRFAAVLVAAGQGLRAGQPLPKQFASWRGKPMVRHAAEALAAAGAGPLVVAIPKGAEAIAGEALAGIPGIRLVGGGATRQDSVRAALEALEADAPTLVLIHDAARPDCPAAVVDRLIAALAGARRRDPGPAARRQPRADRTRHDGRQRRARDLAQGANPAGVSV